MAYTKTTWVNGATALSQENMNHIEQGIYDAHEGLADSLGEDLADLDTDSKTLVGAINEVAGNVIKVARIPFESITFDSSTANNQKAILHCNYPTALNAFKGGGSRPQGILAIDSRNFSVLGREKTVSTNIVVGYCVVLNSDFWTNYIEIDVGVWWDAPSEIKEITEIQSGSYITVLYSE